MINLVNSADTIGSLLYPRISFSADDGRGMISGESYMDDSKLFYGEIMEWLRNFDEQHPGDKFELVIKLNYFNTSTSKMLFDMLLLLSELYEQKREQITIRWFYPAGDPDLLDDINDMSEDSGIEIQVVEM